MNGQMGISYDCKPVQEEHVAVDERSAEIAVVETIAELEEAEPEELPPLANSIEPEVIDTFISSTESASAGALCFTYNDWNVFVRADGAIVVGDPEKITEPTPLF